MDKPFSNLCFSVMDSRRSFGVREYDTDLPIYFENACIKRRLKNSRGKDN